MQRITYFTRLTCGLLLLALHCGHRALAQDPGASRILRAQIRLQTENPAADGLNEADAQANAEGSSITPLLSSEWHEFGPVTSEIVYIGELFNNARGGIRTKDATRYRGNLDFTLELDTEKAGWWTGGRFFVYMQQTHGTTLTRLFIGDGQFYSNIDTSPFPQDITKVSAYWYEHTHEALTLKAGRLNSNLDFAYAGLAEDFLNSSYATLPNVPLNTWPFMTPGITALYKPDPKLRLGGGVYDQGHDYGQWWMTTTTRGVFVLCQADVQPFADQEDIPYTQIRLGAWYTTSNVLSVDKTRDYAWNYGLYAMLDRILFYEPDSKQQGLGTFLQFSWAPADRNEVDQHYGAGLIYRGLLPDHDEDVLGVGFTLIAFSTGAGHPANHRSENTFELFYQARLGKSFMIQPDLQYIARPSGVLRDALAIGMRFEANF